MKTKDLTRREILTLGAAASATAGLVASLDPREAAAGKPAKKTLPQVPRRILGKTGESVPILLMLTAFFDHIGRPNLLGFIFGEPLFQTPLIELDAEGNTGADAATASEARPD